MELCSMLCSSLNGRGVWGEWYMYMYGWISLLFTWNCHNIVNKAVPQYKKKIKTFLSISFSFVALFSFHFLPLLVFTYLEVWTQEVFVQPTFLVTLTTIFTVQRCLKKRELPYDSAIPLLGIYLDKTIIQKDLCTHMFVAALFTIKKQRYYFADKGPFSQSYGFSSSHVWMWELDYKEGWALKNWLMLLNCVVGDDSWESLG